MIDMNYVNKLRDDAKNAVRAFNSDEQNRVMLRNEEKKDQLGYSGSTFLYIRGYDGDTGNRPIPSGTVFWLSPDIVQVFQNRPVFPCADIVF